MPARWSQFAAEATKLAALGVKLLYQGNVHASAFLATVGSDGGPRVHPVFPVIDQDDLWLFIVNLSPKYRDLVRNGFFALHTLPSDSGGEEFHMRGVTIAHSDPATKARVVAATGGRQGGNEFEALFRCELTSILYTCWENWGTEQAWPRYAKWRADQPA